MSRGSVVVLKPNYGVPISSTVGATTHPDVVVALIEAAQEANAGRIIVAESSVVGFDAGQVMARLGVAQRFEKAGARVVNLDQSPEDIVEKKISGGSLLKKIKIFRQALDCDVLVSVPVLKTHIYTTVSLGMKNLKGTLPDSQKKIMHRVGVRRNKGDQFELDRGIADMMTAHSPDLTVIDATVGQEGFVQNAGVCGTPVPMNAVVVGTDFVAADAVGADLMGFDPLQINHIRFCHELGLGAADMKQIQTVGEDPGSLRRRFRPAVPGELGDYDRIVVKEGGSCSGCSVAIRCALNSFTPRQIAAWKPAVIFVGGEMAAEDPAPRRRPKGFYRKMRLPSRPQRVRQNHRLPAPVFLRGGKIKPSFGPRGPSVSAAVTVRVVFSPVFRTVFHCPEKELMLTPEDASVNALLAQLSKASGGKIDKLVFDMRKNLISTALMVQVNDRTFTGNALNRRSVPLDDRDVVSLLYYISGG